MLAAVVLKKEECVAKFDKMFEIMQEKGHLTAKEVNDAKHQFNDFIHNITKKNFELLSMFDWGKECLDDFVGNGWIRARSILPCGRPWYLALFCWISQVGLN